ncbi:MAG: argininosuccinate lyase [Candidatus Diapherotrites archaeon]|uniref:Argininosuccinate lyase n=1 Tax=Candidatus Iainarchaeum sp. TaxID=3101447 RepID=A0A939C9Y7_9ARCH|nr:argininosuccinate lyase [Candidatus Diapherotrites archaeon]
MKLWDKGHVPLDERIERFTVGSDFALDQNLVLYDCLASIAHAKMLQKIHVLKPAEFKMLQKELVAVINLDKKGLFKMQQQDEDVHTKIENHLTKKLGDLGKKIHTARSRNDQVLADLRLYSKRELQLIIASLLELSSALLHLAKRNEFVPMPGYTHTRQAMPSSIGLWVGSFVESLLDDLRLLWGAYDLNNQNPLGSAAGYGVALPIDRQLTTKLLGFKKLQNNTLYVQSGRGKIESVILSALLQVNIDLGRLASDLILFSSPEFNFVRLPEEFCTGSSMMPHKQNPDVLELMRGKSAMMQGYLIQIINVINGMYSGYHRDLQLTKEPLMQGLALEKDCLDIFALVAAKIKVNRAAASKACRLELFATDKALELAEKGLPFRDAYRVIAESKFDFVADPVENVKRKTHLGAPGNQCLGMAEKQILEHRQKLREERKNFERAIAGLTRL